MVDPWCAEHDKQLGGASPLSSPMTAKDERSARASSRRGAWRGVEQSRDPMDKNRIRGLRGQTIEPLIAKSIAAKGRGGKSGGCAVQAVGCASGGLSGPRLFGAEREPASGHLFRGEAREWADQQGRRWSVRRRHRPRRGILGRRPARHLRRGHRYRSARRRCRSARGRGAAKELCCSGELRRRPPSKSAAGVCASGQGHHRAINPGLPDSGDGVGPKCRPRQ